MRTWNGPPRIVCPKKRVNPTLKMSGIWKGTKALWAGAQAGSWGGRQPLPRPCPRLTSNIRMITAPMTVTSSPPSRMPSWGVT